MNIIPLICVVGAILGGETANAGELKLFGETQRHMATDFTIQVYAADEAAAKTALAAAFEKIAVLDRMMTDYDPESELSRLGTSSPHAAPVAISDDLWRILTLGRAVSQSTEGAFDVTIGPLTKAWRQARRQNKLPAEDKLTAALAAVGYKQLELSPPDAKQKTAQLMKPHMRLDLGGIAQGYAADRALEVLKAHGLSRALVNASGDIVVADPPPGEKGWKIALAKLDPRQPPTSFITLANAAISNSGDAYQFVEVEGKRYSHIVDPHTGIGLTTRMSVSVIAKDGTTADAFASGVCVLGPERGLAVVRRAGLDAHFVIAHEDGVQTKMTAGFAKQIEELVDR
jgi:thiamine biosynthesis lipoprotein